MWIGMSKYFRKWPVECGSFPSLSLWQWPLSKEASLDSHSYQDDYGIKNSVWGSWFDGRRLIASPNWRLYGIGFFDSYRWACEKKGVLWNSSGYSYICTLTCCDEPQYFPYLNRYTTYNQDLPDIPCIFHENILLKPFLNLSIKSEQPFSYHAEVPGSLLVEDEPDSFGVSSWELLFWKAILTFFQREDVCSSLFGDGVLSLFPILSMVTCKKNNWTKL